MRQSFAHALCTAAMLVASALGAFAQNAEPRVTAKLSTGVAKLGEQVVLQVVAENVSSGTLEPLAAIDGLRISAFKGPFPERSISNINGRVSQYVAAYWTAQVQPLKVGEFTIPPMSVKLGARVLQTAALSLTVVADLRGEDLGFIQVIPSTKKVIDGQPVSVEVRFGWDARMTRYNYAILSLPWWRQLEGAVENPSAPTGRPPTDVYGFIDNERFEGFEELEPTTVRGVPFRTFRTVKSFTPTRAGTLEFSTSSLEFGRVVRSDAFFPLRQSLERAEQFFARGEPLSIEVIPLPENGRPFDFGGAVGTFAVKAGAEPRDVTAGDSIKFKVEWTGSGNLEFFEAPAPELQDAFKGFRVYGKTETKTVDRRVVVYDLAPLEPSLVSIPPLEMPVFDPATMKYERLATPPIPIHVRPLKDAKTLASEGEVERTARDLVDIDAHATPSAGLPRVPAGVLLGALVLAPVLALGVRARVRRRGDPNAPAEKRRRKARRTLERELAAPGDARAHFEAFCEFLGARTKEQREAWIGRRIDGVHATALAPDLAHELERELGELEHAAWSGDAREPDRGRLLALADRLIAGGL